MLKCDLQEVTNHEAKHFDDSACTAGRTDDFSYVSYIARKTLTHLLRSSDGIQIS